MKRRLADRSSSTADTVYRKRDLFRKESSQPLVDLTCDKIYEQEKLHIELQQVKMDYNKIMTENTKLRTQLALVDKDLYRYEKICENMGNDCKSKEIILLRKHNKELQESLNQQLQIVEQLKKNCKVTNVQELECENKIQYTELLRLRKLFEGVNARNIKLNLLIKQLRLIESQFKSLIKTQEVQQLQEQNLKQKLKTTEEQLYLIQNNLKNNQDKADKRIIQLLQQNKKLCNEKANLKVTIQMIQEKSILKNKEIQKIEFPKILIEELKYKLILRGITSNQLNEMLDGLKQQAKQLGVIIVLEDFKQILTQEPFGFCQIEDKDKIEKITYLLKGSGDILLQQFRNIIGSYDTFINFNFDDAQINIYKLLQQKKQQIQDYFKGNQIIDILQVQKMIDDILLLDNQNKLFYCLNLYEKSNENLNNIKVEYLIDPFVTNAHITEQEEDEEQSENSIIHK